MSFFGAVAQYLGLGILFVLVLIPLGLWRLNLEEWKRTLIVIAYVFLIWTVITRL